jgi:mRNA-degrading endonuclease RelE of RelBE toxin-antitoxin system
MFKLYLRPKALKVFERINRETQLKINVALDDLKLGEFRDHNIKKIKGTEFGYRLRIGRWRILFALFSKEKKIEIVDIFIKKGKGDYFKRKELLD